MFDLTKNIQLSPNARKKYAVSRLMLHIAFVAAALFVADRILFPIVPLDFSFANISSLKNTIVAPRLGETNQPSKSSVSAGNSLMFDANPFGRFSSMTLTITTDEATQDLSGTNAQMRKSYQAFFYPLGTPVGFRDGSLVTADGNYYIVSSGFLRRFANTEIIAQFGFDKSAFQTISSQDLRFNKIGPDINNSNTYPDSTLFSIGENYFELKNQQLVPFISSRAYLSQFDPNQAIVKGTDFLNTFPQSDASIGFANGTLASSAQSVFILSNGKSYPIADANTFASFGFDWNNVIALDSEELGSYALQKQFTIAQPHPDGTLFEDPQSKKYFIVENGLKHPIESASVLQNYAKQNVVFASEEGASQKVSCSLKKHLLSGSTYSCQMPIDQFANVPGNDYQISIAFQKDAKIKTINTTFSTPINWLNLKTSISTIKQRLTNNYSQQQ